MHCDVVDRAVASSYSQGALVLWGDYGGHTWLICRASLVEATDEAVAQLAVDLGARFPWSSPDLNGVRWVLTDFFDLHDPATAESTHPGDLWINPGLVSRGVTKEGVEAILFSVSHQPSDTEAPPPEDRG